MRWALVPPGRRPLAFLADGSGPPRRASGRAAGEFRHVGAQSGDAGPKPVRSVLSASPSLRYAETIT